MNTAIGATAQPAPTEPESKPRRRRRITAASVVIALAAAGGVLAFADPFGGAKASGGADGDGPTARATVRRGSLSSRVNQTGTLSYAGARDGAPYAVVNQASGVFTSLPDAGDVVHCGEVLYRVTNDPVVLLCGDTAASRPLSQGMRGPDVHELNRNLVRLDYAKRSNLDPSSQRFGEETSRAVRRLQKDVGVDRTGSLALGQAVVLPGPVRIAKVTAKPGAPARPGAPVADATSTRREVQVDLSASQQSSVHVGDRAQITLPNNDTTTGTVSRIGTIASSSTGGGAGSDPASTSSDATLPVYIRLEHAKAAGHLDQAPVRVQITTRAVQDALIVPVTALLAQSGGGYAVETVAGRSEPRLVPVTLGLFDDADGLVQVTSSRLSAGQQIVVPST
jgi:peptidoglycan hydrolase-like protein with peptidoglycan-binding domain